MRTLLIAPPYALRLVVVLHPYVAVERRRRRDPELRRTGHRPGGHETNPWRGRRKEAWWRRLPNAGSWGRRSPPRPGVPAIIGSQCKDTGRGLLAYGDAVEFSFVVSWYGTEIIGILLIERGCLSRIQGDQHVVSCRGHGRLRQRWNLHVWLDCIRGERITANRVHCVVHCDLNDCNLDRTLLWRLAAHDGDAVVRHCVPEHNGIRIGRRVLRFVALVARWCTIPLREAPRWPSKRPKDRRC